MGTVKGQLISGETWHDFLGKCFANALIEVIRTSAGLEVYEDMDNMEQSRIQADQVSGMMLLCGENNALLSVTMTCETASSLLSYMTGALPEEIKKEEVWDGAAELANIIAGRAKAELTGTEYHFSINPPFSVAGRDYSIVYKSSMPRIYKRFMSEDMEMFLEVIYI